MSASHRDRRCGRLALAVALLVTLAPVTSHAQDYPSRPIRLIVPFPAGGLNDVVARIIQPHLEKAFGQPVIVDNRPGASGAVGADAVAKAPPDGHMLLVVASSYTVMPATNPKLSFNAERDLAGVAVVGQNPLLFVVSAKVAAKSLGEFVALAKAEPGKLNYSSPGAASQTHLVAELFSQTAGIKLLHIPYRGGGPAIMALVTGEAHFTATLPARLDAADPGRHAARGRRRQPRARSAAARPADRGRAGLPGLRSDSVGGLAHHRRARPRR